MSELEIDLMAVEFTELRALEPRKLRQTAGAGSELAQDPWHGSPATDYRTRAFEAVGYYANPYVPDALKDGWNEEPVGPEYAAPIAPRYFNWRKASIYGGSNEIQKGIIAKMVLGL